MNPAMKGLLVTDILIRFCEQIPYAFVVVWCMKMITAPVSAVQFGLLTTIEMATAVLVYIPVAYLADRSTKKPFVLMTFVFFTLFPLVLLYSRSFEWLIVAFILRGLKEFGEPTRKSLIMDLSPDSCKAGMFGLYYLIRDVFVAVAALGGAFLWQISPQTNLITAFVFGIIGTVGFAIFGRDMPVQHHSRGMHDKDNVNEHFLATVSFKEAFKFWTKLGFISFGGPAGQIAIMHQEVVERRHWIGENQFLRALNFCMLLPGPEAQQLATYIGWRLARHLGGIAAGSLFVIPSIFVMLLLSYLAVAHIDIPAVAAAFYGIQPVVVAVVIEAVLRIGKKALKHRVLYGFAALAFIAIFFLKVPFPYIVAAAAAGGLLMQRVLPRVFCAGAYDPETKSAALKLNLPSG